jgi:hypothetical protein
MDFCLHNHPIFPPAVALAEGEGGDVHICTLGPVLEVVAANGGCPLSERAQMWKSLNRGTDDCTPTYNL